MTQSDHEARVDAWLEARLGGPAPAEILDVLSEGFDAVWRRAQLPLGDVTLIAVGDRVLRQSARRHPRIAGIRLGTVGLDCDKVRARGAGDAVQLRAAVRFLMVELLTVLGTITADILTPALHAELERLGSVERAPTGPLPRRDSSPAAAGEKGES